MIAASEDYPTSDTPLAAHLLTEGFKLKDIYHEDSQAFFVFEDTEALANEVHKFELFNAVSSNASKLIDNYRYLVKRARGRY